MSFLPKSKIRVKTVPVKCQGIKTKLIPFIGANIAWDGAGVWIEPFMGSGVVAFNILPDRALLSDTNKHIIKLYQDIQSGRLDDNAAKEFLHDYGSQLLQKGEDFYYEVRKEFNQKGGSLEFLFLNRACFNGVVRFNSKGGFNVPFGKKPNRFRQAYITKIANQIRYVKHVLSERDWKFAVADWRDSLRTATREDFVYLDPPYIGRHTDYFNSWSDSDALELAAAAQKLPCGFALSMWESNKYRSNSHLDEWHGVTKRSFAHFYHIGSTESLRNEMLEALLIKDGFAAVESQSSKVESSWAQRELILNEDASTSKYRVAKPRGRRRGAISNKQSTTARSD